MTRSDLLTKLARRTNKNTTLDTATQNRLLDFLNERQRRILSLPGMQKLRAATTSLASVEGRADYALARVARLHRIFETTNDRVLYEMSPQDYRRLDPDPQMGTPEAFIWRGRQAVAKQPADASELSVVSTSASDTNTAYVEGVITGGDPRTASVTMTGTTEVSLSASILTWERVDKFYLSTAAVGTVTLQEDINTAPAKELARIPIGATSTDYWGLTLWPTPSAVITYTIDYDRTVTDLAQSTDVPVLDEDFHDLLLLGALMDEYQYMSDERWHMAHAEYTQRLGQLRYRIAATATGGSGRLTRRTRPGSQLGAWYPAGT